MKTRTLIGGLVLAGAITAGAAGTAIAQQSGGSPNPPTTASTSAPASTASDTAKGAAKGARKDFVCSHQDQLADLLAQRKSIQASRLTLEKEARQAAVDAHADALVARIDKRIAATTKAQAQVAKRTEKLTSWEAKNCTG